MIKKTKKVELSGWWKLSTKKHVVKGRVNSEEGQTVRLLLL